MADEVYDGAIGIDLGACLLAIFLDPLTLFVTMPSALLAPSAESVIIQPRDAGDKLFFKITLVEP